MSNLRSYSWAGPNRADRPIGLGAVYGVVVATYFVALGGDFLAEGAGILTLPVGAVVGAVAYPFLSDDAATIGARTDTVRESFASAPPPRLIAEAASTALRVRGVRVGDAASHRLEIEISEFGLVGWRALDPLLCLAVTGEARLVAVDSGRVEHALPIWYRGALRPFSAWSVDGAVAAAMQTAARAIGAQICDELFVNADVEWGISR